MGIVSSGCEAVATGLWGDLGEGGSDRRVQIWESAGGGFTQVGLQFGEHLFDRVEVRRVGRKVEHLGAHRLDRLPDAGHLVSAEVVEDHRVASLQHGDQGVGDVGAEALTVGGSVEQGRGGHAARAQGRRDGDRLPVAVRDGDPAALAARRPAVAVDHVGRGRRLVEEDEAVGIEFVLGLEPVLALGSHVRPLLLGGVPRIFLCVMRWRLKKRDKPLSLVAMSRSASRARSSERNSVGCSARRLRIRSAWASTCCERRSPPCGLAATRPSRSKLSCQRMALAGLTPNRSAA